MSKPIRVGLAGLGRIGRNLFRILYRRDDLRIGAISEIADHKTLEYLVRFDTIFGPLPDEVRVEEGHLYAYGRQIPMLVDGEPGQVPWGDLGVDVVVEATGRRRSRAELERHLEAGARRVVLCAPPEDPPDATIVIGVNDGELRPEHRIVSNASCTAHAAAPILKILDGAFGVERAFLSTGHAYTNEQRLADVPSEDPRRGRAAAENIIPQETNAAEMVMRLLPGLKGRVTGEAINVPVPNGSLVDIVCWHDKPVTPTAINEVVRTAADSRFPPGIVHFEDDPIVSSDVEKSHYSATFDSLATMVLGEKVSKTITWYDNGWGYAHRVVDLIGRLAALEQKEVA